jgi:hypothetical protein
MGNNKEYLLSGTGFTAYFKTIKDRNSFKKQLNDIYTEMAKDSKYKNKTALNNSIAIALAKSMKVNINLHGLQS